MLLTSRISYENVRALQRKLYLKAKQESTFRFYTLYDKIYQYDILHHAYDRVKQNKGSSGIDGVTFESIELNIGKTAYLQELQASLQSKTYRSQPVKRVEIPKANGATRPLGIPCIRDRIVQMAVKLVIEPIFEASFAKHSYGFRPKRSAHQAIGAIEKGLLQGHAQVIDADLSKYFDTIPHNNLLRTVSEKLLDGKVIHLIKQWLRVPVIQVRNGKQEVVGGKKTRKGTPQGGVISPLLANIYLNILDRIWEKHQLSSRYKARLIRYADDMVILCKGGSEMPYAILKKLLGKLGLILNESKTCIVNSRKQAFQFLGFSIQLTKKKKCKNGEILSSYRTIEDSDAIHKSENQSHYSSKNGVSTNGNIGIKAQPSCPRVDTVLLLRTRTSQDEENPLLYGRASAFTATLSA